MFAAGQKDMQQMDAYTMDTLGLSGEVLMENAGAQVVTTLKRIADSHERNVVIVAGSGNNGGDGFVIARRLADLGWQPKLFLLVDPSRLQGDARTHYKVYAKRNLPICYYDETKKEMLTEALANAHMIVDAMLGTGIRGKVREPFAHVISLVNEYENKKPIIAVDIPSGVQSDSGIVEGVAVKASHTVSFVFPKKGFFLADGPAHIGTWEAVDISVPPSIVDELHLHMPRVLTSALATSSIPPRPQTGHKGTFGHVLVVGGSTQYVGAPIFTATAASHCGAGLVTLAVPEKIYPMVAARSPESLLLSLPHENGHMAEESVEKIIKHAHKFSVIAIGPGLSRFPKGDIWIQKLISSLNGQRLVLDADALYLMKDQLHVVKEYEGDVIFTPHPGEMATLLHTTVEEVERNRLDVARTFATENGLYLLLKGHRSVVATPTGDMWINPLGHDALGKGGSGDVLTGMISAMLAQGATPKDALLASTYLHAKAGEKKAEVLSRYGVMPADIIEGVKEILVTI